jgi:perosamine synthetase
MNEEIPLSRPDITDSDIRAVVATLRSARLHPGKRLSTFEHLVAMRAGREHGIGVNSATSGLLLSLMGLGIGPGDEVICPALSFVAVANCVEHLGAKPVFVDCDPRTLCVRAEDVEAAITPETRAIIGVEVFGNPAGIDRLATLSTKYEVPLVEYAAEAIGARLGTDPVGSYGRVAIFGFHPNKQITTGEGGMIVTDDDRMATLCRSMRNHGRPADIDDAEIGMEHWLTQDLIGYNFRLSELAAALGVAQIQRLDSIIEARQQVAMGYIHRLMSNTDLILPTIVPGVSMSWFTFVIRLSDRYTPDDRDEIMAGLRRHDVGAGDYFPPIPMLPYYRRKYGYNLGDFPVAESVSGRTLALPFYTTMTDRDVDFVCQTLEMLMRRMTFSRRA